MKKVRYYVMYVVLIATRLTFAQIEIIQNGNFASGSLNWNLSGNFYADSRFSNCRSCPGYAYLSNADGTAGNNLVGIMYQTVSIPSDASSALLKFWYYITTQEISANAIDILNITLQNSSGQFLEGVATLSNINKGTGYSQFSYDVSAYIGQTIRVNFVGTTDGSLPTAIRIDDVSINVVIPEITYTLNIYSENPSSDVAMAFTPDVNGKFVGNTPTSAIYNKGANVSVTAVSSVGNNVFKEWKLDGSYYSNNNSVALTMNSDNDLTAVYEPEEMQLHLEVDPGSVQNLDWQGQVDYTCTVTDQNGNPVNNSGVGGVNGLTNSSFNVFTNEEGVANYTVNVPDNTPDGIYGISFIAVKNGYISSSIEERQIEVEHEEVPSAKVVKAIYLVPADKSVDEDYKIAIENAIKNVQVWYRIQMGNGKTFTLSDPVVEVYSTPHNADWYSSNPNGDSILFFWNNVSIDAFSVAGAPTPDITYVYYIDADPKCKQYGGAGVRGYCILPANDLRGLKGEPEVHICPGDNYNYPPCRFVGGLGHELGHALGLPHPPECEQNSNTCNSKLIMWLGYLSYPDSYLNDDEKAILNNSPFISLVSLQNNLPQCDYLIPVELISFSSSVNVNTVTLKWTTATETNNKGFEIQRQDKTGNWQNIDFIDGNGTSAELKYYSYADRNLNSGKYFYRLKQSDFDESFQYSDILEVIIANPIKFSLEQNYPNPFNPTTTIEFTIPSLSTVLLKVYDIIGNEIKTLVNEERQPGFYKFNFSANGLPSGVYFYSLKAGSFAEVKKFTILK